jgi:pentapeptide MXKDX repeat protein
MKRFAIAFTALTIASVAIAPKAYAAPNFDELRRHNLEQDASSLDTLRRENLDKDASGFDQLRRENLDKDAFLEVQVKGFDQLRRVMLISGV